MVHLTVFVSVQTGFSERLFTDCRNKRVLSVTVKAKQFVMQHRLFCSQLGG